MFSIVIPCKDRLELLELVLIGFINQHNPPPFEVILADNNSESDIDSLYRRYNTSFPLYLVRQPAALQPFSASSTRNTGLKVASFDWVVSLDSDCVPNPDYLRNAANSIMGDTTMMLGERVFVSVDEFNPAAELINDPHRMTQWPLVESLSNYYKLRDRRFPSIWSGLTGPHPWAFAHSGNFIFRRKESQRIGDFDPVFDGCWGYEDIDFAHRLLRASGVRIQCDPGLTVYHCETAESRPDPRRVKQMMDKENNRNWHYICDRIPGYREYKKKQYAEVNSEIAVL